MVIEYLHIYLLGQVWAWAGAGNYLTERCDETSQTRWDSGQWLQSVAGLRLVGVTSAWPVIGWCQLVTGSQRQAGDNQKPKPQSVYINGWEWQLQFSSLESEFNNFLYLIKWSRVRLNTEGWLEMKDQWFKCQHYKRAEIIVQSTIFPTLEDKFCPEI